MSKKADRNVSSTGVVTSHFWLSSPEDYTVLFVKHYVLTVAITEMAGMVIMKTGFFFRTYEREVL